LCGLLSWQNKKKALVKWKRDLLKTGFEDNAVGSGFNCKMPSAGVPNKCVSLNSGCVPFQLQMTRAFLI